MSYLNLFGTSPTTPGYDSDQSSLSSSSSSRSLSGSSIQFTSGSSTPSYPTRPNSFSTTKTSNTSPKKRTTSTAHPPYIPVCNNGAPIELPILPRRSSKAKRPILDTSYSATSSQVSKVSASASGSATPVLRPLRPGEQYAGSIGKLDESTVTVEVELSSEAARKAENSIWWVPRH
jgi:hypothetical protein